MATRENDAEHRKVAPGLEVILAKGRRIELKSGF